MSQTDHRMGSQRLRTVEPSLEISKALILSLAALLSAWCGYQSTLWSGVSAADFNRASAVRLESVNLTFLSVQTVQADLTLFNAWLDASQSGDSQRTAYIEDLFNTDLSTAFEAWRALGTIPEEAARGLTPFDLPEYQVLRMETIYALDQQADTYFTDALNANEIGDNYVFNTVLLALGLFLTGISDQFGRIGLRLTMRVITTAIIVAALVTILNYPRI